MQLGCHLLELIICSEPLREKSEGPDQIIWFIRVRLHASLDFFFVSMPNLCMAALFFQIVPSRNRAPPAPPSRSSRNASNFVYTKKYQAGASSYHH